MSDDKHGKLVLICESLSAQGLTPGVGLLRGHAPFSVSVIDAINAIKAFNLKQQQIAAKKPDLTDKQRIIELEKRVSQLEQALAVMESRLEKLL